MDMENQFAYEDISEQETEGGSRIYIDDYTISYNSIRIDLVDAIEKLIEKRNIESAAMTTYLDRLKTKSSTLLGSIHYAR